MRDEPNMVIRAIFIIHKIIIRNLYIFCSYSIDITIKKKSFPFYKPAKLVENFTLYTAVYFLPFNVNYNNPKLSRPFRML